MNASKGFREQQRACGFDTGKIEQMRLAVLGRSSAPCIQPSVPVVHDRMSTTPMLKRADGSLMAFTGIGYTTLFKLERAGKFPARRQLSPGRVAWVKAEVEAWLLGRECVKPE